MAAADPRTHDIGAVPREVVRAALERILRWESFAASKRLSSFLRFVVEHTLSGETAEIKEYRIGVEVYGRGPAFDSRIDNIVRVEASRLRSKLRAYYEGIGADDPVGIEIPKGTYTPVFYRRSGAAAPEPPKFSSVVSLPSVTPGKPSVRRLTIWGAVLTAMVALASWYGYSYSQYPYMRRSVAVLGFKDATGPHAETAWLSSAFSEMLTMDLAGDNKLRAVPIDTVSQVKTDLGIDDSDGLMPAALQRVRQRAGVDLVVDGVYTMLPDNGQIRFDLRVQDARTGETVATVSETGTANALFSIVDRAASALRGSLHLPARSGETAMAALPAVPGAMRLYAEGLNQLRQSNAIAARDLLARAVETDPSNALAYAALASSWDALGYAGKAQEAAQKAYQLAGHLNRVEQLDIEGRYLYFSHRWDDAIHIYQTLWTTLPDDIDDGLTLAETQHAAGRARDELDTVLKLRKLPRPLRDDPRIDMAQARALGGLADFRGTREYAARAAQKAQAQGARSLYAQALLLESGAMSMLSMPGDHALRDEARRVCTELGDQGCVLHALRVQANVMVFSDPAGAQALYEEGLRIARRMGSYETINLLNGMSVALEYLDDPAGAEKALKEAIALVRAADSDPAGLEMNLAGNYADQGRVDESAALFKQVVDSVRAGGSRETLGNALVGWSAVERLRAEIANARRHAEEGLTILRGVGVAADTATGLNALAAILTDSGDLAAAEKDYNEALKIELQANKSGQTYGGSLEFGRARLGLAYVALAENQPAAAQERAQSAIRDAENAKDMSGALLARALLVDALTAQHKFAQAQSETGAANAAAAARKDPYPRLNIALAAARLTAAMGGREAATRDLAAVIASASRAGYVRLALEARLARAEIDHARGDSAALARAAAAQGFILLAREARAYGQ